MNCTFSALRLACAGWRFHILLCESQTAFCQLCAACRHHIHEPAVVVCQACMVYIRFIEGDVRDPAANSKRHNMLKLIPSVPQGSWIIKQAVGSTPVLLGNKISTTYHRWAVISNSVEKQRFSLLELIPQAVYNAHWHLHVAETPLLLGNKISTTYHRWAVIQRH